MARQGVRNASIIATGVLLRLGSFWSSPAKGPADVALAWIGERPVHSN
jgi:hypothetical protein